MKSEFNIGDTITVWTEQGTVEGNITKKQAHGYYDDFGNGLEKSFTYHAYTIELTDGEVIETVQSGKFRLVKHKDLPKGYIVGQGVSGILEEHKGIAAFRMWHTSKGKLHIEVWTPNMPRRKEKEVTVGIGTEKAYVKKLYKMFTDYIPDHSTKACFITKHGTMIPIDYCPAREIAVINSNQKSKIKLESLRQYLNDHGLLVKNVRNVGNYKKAIAALNNLGSHLAKHLGKPAKALTEVLDERKHFLSMDSEQTECAKPFSYYSNHYSLNKLK